MIRSPGIALLLPLLLLGACSTTPVDLMDPAGSPVAYVLHCSIRNGRDDAFRSLMAEMVAATKSEPGTLVYEWYLAEDGRTCHILERFADTAAYKIHGDSFGARFAERFMACVEINGLDAYGRPDATAIGMMESLHPVLHTAIGGFRR